VSTLPEARGDDTAERLAALERENAKLRKINKVLMDRVERSMDFQGNAFSLFQTSIVLESRIRERTLALESAMRELGATNDALTAAEAMLSEAIESISEGFVLCDARDHVVLTNSKYREMWPALLEGIEDGLTFEDLLRQAATSGIVAEARDDPDGWVARRLDHHRRPGEPFVIQFVDGMWLQVSERRTRDGGTVGLYTDITEIKISEKRRRERELAEKSVLLQATLDNLSQGVSVFDRSRRLVAWNQRFRQLLDIPPGLVRADAPLEDFLPLPAMAAQAGDGPLSGPLVLEHETAHDRVLEIRRNRMPDGGFVTPYTDITDRRQAAEALREAKEGLERRVQERTAELRRAMGDLDAARQEAEQANLSKTRFLAAASHDLLQPLAAARVFTSALADRRLAPRNRALVRSSLAALDSVDGLLSTLLDISRLDAGVLPVDRQAVRLSDLMAPIHQEHQALARAKGLDLRVLPSAALVDTDPRLLGRILRNLISNAIRYTDAGRILVGARRRGDAVMIGVWDTGCGIPDDKLEEIFEEFHRLHRPSERGERGMGLGLAIVRRIARMLDHPLEVRSTFGQGSLFAVRVPLASAETPPGPPPAAAPRPAVPAQTLKGVRVLMIDNEPDILDGMAALLGGWGCAPRGAPSQEAALDILATQPADARPQVVIADYHLDDGRNGLEAIAAVRAVLGPALPAVVVTANRSPELVRDVQDAGAHLLNKPVRPGRLRSVLAHLLTGDTA